MPLNFLVLLTFKEKSNLLSSYFYQEFPKITMEWEEIFKTHFPKWTHLAQARFSQLFLSGLKLDLFVSTEFLSEGSSDH